MVRVNTLCWFGYHKFNKDFCARCGVDRELQKPQVINIIKGKSQFIEPVSGKERFDNAGNIGDLLNNG